MSKLLHRMWRSPRLSRVLFAVAAPTLATIFFAPAWAIGLSIIAALGAATFIYSEVLSPKYVQQEKKARSSRAEALHPSSSNTSSKLKKSSSSNDAAVNRHKQLVDSEYRVGDTNYRNSGLSNQAELSEEWSNYAWKALASSNSAQQEIRSVINLSTHSAMALANSIRELERNHDTQNHLAKNLLASSNAKMDQQESLADLALVASTILERQNSQLIDTAAHATRLIEKQQAAMIFAARADDLLAKADKAAKQLSMNVMGSGTELDERLDDRADINTEAARINDPWAFVQNHRKALNELRTDLEQIRAALSQVTLDMQDNVNSLRHTAQKDGEAVASVNVSIQKKLDETRSTVNALNELSKDTESHIQASIVAMQYHDIMTQKLAAVDTLHLEAIAVRTRNLVNEAHLHTVHEPVEVISATASKANKASLSPSEQNKTAAKLDKSNEIDLFV